MWDYLTYGWQKAQEVSSWLSYSPVKAVVGSLPVVGELGEYLIDVLKDTVDTEEQYTSFLANPNFINNQIEGDSPATFAYFAAQKMNTLAGYLSGTTIKASRATGAFFALEKYQAWAKAAPKGGSLSTFLELVVRMKQYQVLAGGASTLTSLGSWQLWNPLLAISSKALGVITDLVAEDLVKTYTPEIQVCATALHWRAYRELVVSHGAGHGPAARILRSMFFEYTIVAQKIGGFAKSYGGRVGSLGQGILSVSTALAPEKMADLYIYEPHGWLVFADMLKQL